jgi:hypothetical protein
VPEGVRNRAIIAHTAPPKPAPNADAAAAPSPRARREEDRLGHLVAERRRRQRHRAVDERSERREVAIAQRVADPGTMTWTPRELAKGGAVLSNPPRPAP